VSDSSKFELNIEFNLRVTSYKFIVYSLNPIDYINWFYIKTQKNIIWHLNYVETGVFVVLMFGYLVVSEE
jgi:hypothetical protein